MQTGHTTAKRADDNKPLVWLHGEVKTPPFSKTARQEAGLLLRLLQMGETLEMPQAEPLPDIGPRCGALRVRDADHHWRIVFRIDADAILVLDVYSKKTRKMPDEVRRRCQNRIRYYDSVTAPGRKGQRKRDELDE